MCILLVEDEFVIRELMAEALVAEGFEIMDAASGDEALVALEAGHRHFTALVTDLNMPGQTDGTVLAEHMRAHFPDIPVVFATGRPDSLQPEWLRRHGYRVLRKPYRPSELVGVLHNALKGD